MKAVSPMTWLGQDDGDTLTAWARAARRRKNLFAVNHHTQMADLLESAFILKIGKVVLRYYREGPVVLLRAGVSAKGRYDGQRASAVSTTISSDIFMNASIDGRDLRSLRQAAKERVNGLY